MTSRPPREESRRHRSGQRLPRQRSNEPAGAPEKQRGFPPLGFSRWGEFYTFRVAPRWTPHRVRGFDLISRMVAGMHFFQRRLLCRSDGARATIFPFLPVPCIWNAERGKSQNNTVAALTSCHVDSRGLLSALVRCLFCWG